MQITESELSSSIENNDSVNPESNNSSDKSDSNQNIPETSDFSNWFTLRVVSGKEKFVKENIFRELDFQPEIKSKINEIFVPFEKIVVIKNDKKKIKERMFFPGYIMINMLMDVESKYFVENSTSVISFVAPKGKMPAPLREKEVKRIFGEVRRKEGILDVVDVPFKKDDHVKVISGPFIDFNGVVEEVNKDKQKVRVIISIFGRPTPVELDFFQLEMIS
ncbi:MAG: transcription termination/antitermination factor NusG [Candidatus Marinimicrobia bacterium]|nr:transcription termination/antitermination factor NusG [Candidatus Neomarinimicrobiota bacterium]|tara:strand:+ start:76 stop:735 length:660 start_codon:yes stop_codon:yes gene_type:complete